MPAPPRPGRKGGKVTTSATTPESTPLPADAVSTVGEKPAVAIAAVNEGEAAPVAETENKKSSWSDGTLQMDKDAIQHVGKGNLVRGLKTARTETHEPVSSLSDVQKKLKDTLSKQKPTRYNLKTVLRESMDATSKNSVAIINPNDGHLLAVQLAGESPGPSKILVVVPHYYEVSETAAVLREMREARREPSDVGELVGATVRGEKTYNLWVTSAESANLYLFTKGSFSPFTHIVFPELLSITPLVSFFIFAIRNHMQSCSPEETVKLIIGTTIRYSARLCEYFSSLEVKCLVNRSNTVDFSYDECCALAEKEVLQLIGATSQRLPEKKVTQHCCVVATSLVQAILGGAPVSQRIHIFTGDCGAMSEALCALDMKDVIVWTKNSLINKVSPTAGKQDKHWIYILNNSECPSVTGYLPPHFVIDLGTMGQRIQPNRDESFVAGRVNVWTTTEELEEHHSLVCPGGGYFQLFPDLSDTRAATSVSYSIYEVETGLLQSARTKIPNGEALLLPIPTDIVENTLSNLSDNCLVVPSGLTFMGEMAARMPLGTDLVTFIIHACTMGLGEPAVVVASVCALSMRRRMGSGEEEVKRWAETVTSSRNKYAGSLASESDLLADALVYLEWDRRMVLGDASATSSFPAEIGCPLPRLQSIRTLVSHLCVQLSDYVFIENLDDAAVIGQISEKLRLNAVILAAAYAVSSSRRALSVRDSGSFKDRHAALSFVRTTKKVYLSPIPSSVEWEASSTLIAADIRTDKLDRGFEGARFTWLSSSFYTAALLLLYPFIVYSAPQDQEGGESIILFAISCNSHKKRFRVPFSQANMILNFREKWNAGLGYLHALRTLPRPVSRQKFFNALREKDRCCNLDVFYEELQNELVQLLLELDVSEYHGSFDFIHSHCLSPNVTLSLGETEASDCVLAREFESAAAWPVTVGKGATPGTVSGVNDEFAERLDDEVEDIADLYFLHNGPIED